MLQSIRERFKGWVVWLIIIAVGGVFVLSGVGYFLSGLFQGGASQKSVATVNGKAIADGTLQQVLQRQANGQPITQSMAHNALSALIQRQLLANQAEALELHISDGQLKAAIEQYPLFLDDQGQFSQQKYHQVVINVARNIGIANPDSGNLNPAKARIENMIAQQERLQQAIMPVLQTIFIGDTGLYQRLLNQTRTIEYVTLKPAAMASKVQVTDQALKQYYQQHQQAYQVPRKVAIDYAVVKLDDFKPKTDYDTAALKQFYEQNPSLFQDQQGNTKSFASVKGSIANILQARQANQKLKALTKAAGTSDFDTLVNRYDLSTDQTDLFDQQTKSDQITGNATLHKAIFQHQQNQGYVAIGDHQGVVYHVVDSQPAHIAPFDQVADTVKQNYQQNQAIKQAQSKAQALLDQSDNVQAFQKQVKQTKGLELKTAQLSVSKSSDTIPKAIHNAIFTTPAVVGKQQDDQTIWVWVTKHVSTSDQSLSQQERQPVQKALMTLIKQAYFNALKADFSVKVHDKALDKFIDE